MHVADNSEAVLQNRALLRQHLPAEPVWLNQTHSATVVNAELVNDLTDADASVSQKQNVVCIVQTADCLPILLCGTNGTVVGAVHGGWRGLANGILDNTVRQMRMMGGDQIMAWLGPAIGPQNFEVGEDVLAAFEQSDLSLSEIFHPVEGKKGKYLADMYALARTLLARTGVSQVSGGGFCTVNEKELFYSYRRDGITGRMGSCIWLK